MMLIYRLKIVEMKVDIWADSQWGPQNLYFTIYLLTLVATTHSYDIAGQDKNNVIRARMVVGYSYVSISIIEINYLYNINYYIKKI